jgi:asparagine synthase (glutamine-hydrolysing)
MCGIAGWFSTEIIPPQELPVLERMIRSINHRGPDEQGTKMLPNACLGHVRLSIIDLNAGQQPMSSHDERFTIIFNGEIYNYKQLRQELLNSGHHFATNSDTEVIMEIYRKYGQEGFSRLRGMYAFALWDNEDNAGLLARDPLGIKPLFYHTTSDSTLVFASEGKAILTKIHQTPKLDIPQLHLLMNFRYLPGNSSLFSGIQQLKPGTTIKWSPYCPLKTLSIDIPEAQDGDTLTQLRNSVHSHLTSDVEVGCYLSGGIDSSTVAALSKEKYHDALRTFTIDIGDDPKEAQYAAETAKHFGFHNLQFKIDNDINQEITDLLWHLEVPKINALQNWQLAKFTSRHVKVALSGLGGDELFLGYNFHKIMAQTASLSAITPSFLTSTSGSLLRKIYNSISRLTWSEGERSLHILEQLGNWPTVYGLIRNVWDSPKMRSNIYGERMLDQKLPNAFEYLEQHWPNNPDPVMAAAQFECREKLVNDLLWQEDRVSMAHGLEVRTPLVDRVLYAHINSYSRDVLMDKNKPKFYMKNTVAPLLPKHILNRPKSGFQVASYEFFHKHLKSLANEQLSKQKVNELGLFNYEFIKHVLHFTPSKRLRWHYFILYFMILTHIWIDLFESDRWSQKL